MQCRILVIFLPTDLSCINEFILTLGGHIRSWSAIWSALRKFGRHLGSSLFDGRGTDGRIYHRHVQKRELRLQMIIRFDNERHDLIVVPSSRNLKNRSVSNKVFYN